MSEFRFYPPHAGLAEAWLRDVAVWSPFVELSYGGEPVQLAFTRDECIEAIADFLATRFPPEAFCQETVKLMAAASDTFPNYHYCCKVLEPLFPREAQL